MSILARRVQRAKANASLAVVPASLCWMFKIFGMYHMPVLKVTIQCVFRVSRVVCVAAFFFCFLHCLHVVTSDHDEGGADKQSKSEGKTDFFFTFKFDLSFSCVSFESVPSLSSSLLSSTLIV